MRYTAAAVQAIAEAAVKFTQSTIPALTTTNPGDYADASGRSWTGKDAGRKAAAFYAGAAARWGIETDTVADVPDPLTVASIDANSGTAAVRAAFADGQHAASEAYRARQAAAQAAPSAGRTHQGAAGPVDRVRYRLRTRRSRRRGTRR